ncbi:MAG: response regulator [Casimicrobiaceae bacterium]
MDDSKLARMAVNKALTGLHPDWIRLEASSAEEAVLTVAREAPDVALLDFNMPDRNGLDLAAELRKLNPEMPVAVISANHQKEIVQRVHDIGARFLPKPLTESALGEFLNEAMPGLKKAQR